MVGTAVELVGLREELADLAEASEAARMAAVARGEAAQVAAA